MSYLRRISSNMLTNSFNRTIQQNYNNYVDLFEQADGDRLHRASDDSVDYAKYMRYQNSLNTNETFQATVSTSLSWMNNSSNALASVGDILNTFKEKMVSAGNSTNTTKDMQDIGKELMAFTEEMVVEMNTQVADRYLFSGQSDTTEPFSISSEKMARGLTKTLSEKQSNFFNVGENYTGSVSQFLAFDGDDGNVYYLDVKANKLYTEDFVNKGYEEKVLAGQETVQDTDSVGSMTKQFVVSDVFQTNGVLTEAGQTWNDTVTIGGEQVKLTPKTILQYVANYKGDDKHISMVNKTGQVQPRSDTVNVNGQDVFGADIFDYEADTQSGCAMLNELLACIEKVNGADYQFNGSDGVTIADAAVKQLLGAQTTIGARNQAYTAAQNMLSTQNEQMNSDVNDIAATDIAKLSVSLTESQTIYSLSLSMGGKVLPTTLADYL